METLQLAAALQLADGIIYGWIRHPAWQKLVLAHYIVSGPSISYPL